MLPSACNLHNQAQGTSCVGWLQVPAASDSDSEGDELVQRYLAESGDSDEDALQGLPQWEQPEGGKPQSDISVELQQMQKIRLVTCTRPQCSSA